MAAPDFEEALVGAISHLRAFARSFANDPAVEKAFKLLQANKVEEARDTLKDHIAAFPQQPYPHYDLAIVYEVKGDWKSAHDSIQEALKLAPDNRTFKEENAFIERHLAATTAGK